MSAGGELRAAIGKRTALPRGQAMQCSWRLCLSSDHGSVCPDVWAPGLLVPGLPHVEDGVSGTDSESWGD